MSVKAVPKTRSTPDLPSSGHGAPDDARVDRLVNQRLRQFNVAVVSSEYHSTTGRSHAGVAKPFPMPLCVAIWLVLAAAAWVGIGVAAGLIGG